MFSNQSTLQTLLLLPVSVATSETLMIYVSAGARLTTNLGDTNVKLDTKCDVFRWLDGRTFIGPFGKPGTEPIQQRYCPYYWYYDCTDMMLLMFITGGGTLSMTCVM